MHLAPDYPIETPRLRLRPLATADVDSLLAYLSLPDVCRYLPFDPMDRAAITERLSGAWARTELTEPGVLTLGVELKADATLIGHVVLMYTREDQRCAELGWVMDPRWAGRGYATEAAGELLGLAFDGLGLHRVVARLDARNTPSAALCRRLGMRQEAHLIENEWVKGEWTDELSFGLLAREWRALGRVCT